MLLTDRDPTLFTEAAAKKAVADIEGGLEPGDDWTFVAEPAYSPSNRWIVGAYDGDGFFLGHL